MSYDAIMAIIDARCCDNDHFSLSFRQSIDFVHQSVVVSEEGAKFIWSVCESQENVRDESNLLMDEFDTAANVLWQFLEGWYGEATDVEFGQDASSHSYCWAVSLGLGGAIG